jgi:hypothetical protein
MNGEQVARMEKCEIRLKFLVGNLGDVDVDWIINENGSYKNGEGECELNVRFSGGLFGFHKCKDYPGQLSNYQLLKGNCIPWS